MFDLKYYNCKLKLIQRAFYTCEKITLLNKYDFNKRVKKANDKLDTFDKHGDLSPYQLALNYKYIEDYAKYFNLEDVLAAKIEANNRTIGNRSFV
jgi:hypothetical protein